ncbi:response regulator [Taibaiella soli]|uniref:DNA-binding response regulator n=1 Tax=Taibaiella soli TaxID=1649169 RepID=A0A2W2AM20_9BACT|nr:response regulator transcription factor [Taibaiella soli]PZF74582.1 DNA-binding response regulator [Taibaiella soli]
MNIRINIADDHLMVINGIKDMLSHYKHIEIGRTYQNGTDLMNGLKESLPDVLLLDIQMPGQSGDELTPLIVRTYPSVRILAITNFDNTLYVNNMLQNGALGYLLKNTDEQTLVTAIETVYQNKQFLKPEMLEKLKEFRRQLKRQTSSKFSLTPREKQILQLIINECSSQEIAEQLNLSLRTIENYRLNLSLKLEVKNMAGLVRKAIMMGLDTPNH